MLFYQRYEIPLCISTESGDAEVLIGGDKTGWLTMQVSEVTSATTRHKDFLAYLIRAFEHDNTATTSSCRECAHQTRGAATQDNYIVISHGGNIAGEAAM